MSEVSLAYSLRPPQECVHTNGDMGRSSSCRSRFLLRIGREKGEHGCDASVGNGRNVKSACHSWTTDWSKCPWKCCPRGAQNVERPVRREGERLGRFVEDLLRLFVYRVVPMHSSFGISEGDVLGIGATYCLVP